MTGDRSLRTLVADAAAAIESPGQIIGNSARSGDRYELFHAANSICAHKVRGTLAYHHIPYVSHSLNLFQGQTYLPAYVRLRMVGCASLGGPLAANHNGSTSASSGGCDGLVVPTLIDWVAEAVVVDSKRICIYLDETMPEEERLRPPELAEAIDAEITIVDNLPNYQMLMGRAISAAEGTGSKGSTGSSFSERKVAWCDRYLEECSGEDLLVQAYTAKRAKELSAATNLFSPEAMARAYALAETSLRDLEAKLASVYGNWLFGDRFTMADLFWGIELLRMENVGVGATWEEGRLPRVSAYLSLMRQIRSLRSAVIEWPRALF